jgi:protein tyrosine/serine phosphatase
MLARLQHILRRYWKLITVIAAIVILPLTVREVYRAWRRYHVRATKMFDVVDEGRLYRSGMPWDWLLKYCVTQLHVKTVVSLSGDVTEPYSNMYVYLQEQGVRHVNLPMYASRTPTVELARKALAVLADTNAAPVLIHCSAGVDRTGYMVALHRVIQQGWTLEQALDEAQEHWMLDRKREKALAELPAVIQALTSAPPADSEVIGNQ